MTEEINQNEIELLKISKNLNTKPSSSSLNESLNESKHIFGDIRQSTDGRPSLDTSTSSMNSLPKSSVFVSVKNLSSSVSLGKSKGEKSILKNLNFFLKPGSMVLILGSPGCGKTSLLNTIALLTSNEKITGSLLFNGRVGDTNTHHRHVSYVVQDDCHMAPLSVRDTFKFSADCQMGDRSEKEKKEKVDQVLEFLGLSHVENTQVGDEFIRGVSGGQKKRVSIGVELVKDSNLLLMDEPTNGLDSSISLEMLTNIRNKVKQEKLSCLVSLLQPGLEIIKLFDYLMVLNQGEMAYFGPMNQGIGYFEGLGFKFPKHHNPAEFFQEIVDEPELYYEGQGEPPIRGAENFAAAYKRSDIYTHIIEYIDNNTMSPDNDFIDYSTLLKQYSTTVYKQIGLNVKRSFQISFGHFESLRIRLLKNIVMGFLLGTLFWKLEANQDGGSNKSGLLFFTLLSFVFGGFSSIAIFFSQRSVFYFQRGWKYYNTMSYFISMIINDIPMSIIEVLVFSNFVYWMVDLNKTWDRFIYFLLVCFVNDVLSQALIRMVCSFTRSPEVAVIVAPAFVSPLLLICGFMQKFPEIPNYWSWVYWISPIHYAFEGLLINEHSGKPYHCDPNEMLPPSFIPNFNLSYPVGFEGNQVCPITNGDQILKGLGFKTHLSYRWVDLAITVGFVILFWTITAICMRFFIFRIYRKDPVSVKRIGLTTSTTIKSNRSSTGHNNEIINTNLSDSSNNDMKVVDMNTIGGTTLESNQIGKSNLNKDIPNGCYMQWKDLVYEVDIKKDGKKQRLKLLSEINGYVKPGMLLALMGPSGAGKSTLLDVLANRKTGGYTSGEILINGQERNKYFTRNSAYVEQMDVLPPSQTVREVILFSANVRLPKTVSTEEKVAFVQSILETLNLVKIQHSLIGSVEAGLSLSQRKRINMGIELASDPQLLFLDEPTSGLDSSAALKVMNLIKKIASSGRSVICTIHQPSTTIFKKFDHLLLLKRGGKTVYFGPTGTNSNEVLSYFAESGLICDPFKNPADFILDVTDESIEITNKEGQPISFDPVETFSQSTLNQQLLSMVNHSIMPEGTPVPEFHGVYSSSFNTQFRELMNRAWKSSIRRRGEIRSRLCTSFLLGVFIGTLFLRIGREQEDIYNRISLLFFSIAFGGMASISVIPIVTTERGVFYREQSSGMYSVLLYFITFVISDLPWEILAAISYAIPMYFLTGLTLSTNGWPFFYHCLVTIFVYLNFSFCAIFLTISFSIQEISFVLNGIVLSIASLFAGFIIPSTSMKPFWKWAYYVDFISYPLKAYIETELKDLDFLCTDNKGAVPIPIPSQNTTTFFCPITKGQQVLDKYSYEVEYQYWNLFIMSSFSVALLFIGYLSLKYIRYQNK